MTKARSLADFVSAGNPLEDGEINIADIAGLTTTTAELNLLSGVTSNIQTQLDTKVAKIDVTGASVGSATAIPVLTFNDQGQITVASEANVSSLTGATFDGATGVLNLATSDGNSLNVTLSSINADLLDGQHGTYYLDANNFVNMPSGYSGWTISDGTNSENVGDGNSVSFVGSGATSVAYNAATNTVTISSTDTNTDTTYSAGGGLSLSGTTFSHTDTSSQASVNNSNGTVIQDVTLDSYGHVTGLASVNLDSRYLPTSGGTINGNLDVNGLITSDRLRIPSATSDPTSPAGGDIYYNTSTNYIRIYDGSGSEWRDAIYLNEVDPYWSDVTILLRDGQYTNYGIASNAANGSGTTTGASDKPTGSNGSFFIDNDWFYVPYNAAFRNFNNTSGLTIEFYAKVTRTGGNHFMGRWSQNGGEFQFNISTPTSSTFRLSWRQEGSQGDLFGVDNTLGQNAWHHYAFVVDVPNKKARTYYDGTLINTATHSGTALYSNSENWHIGYKADSGSVWSGAAYIEGLRVTNQARYTTSFTPPPLPHPTE